jgi:hypothetical protein
MDSFSGRILFEIGSQKFAWEDMVLSAQLRNDWHLLLKRIRMRLSCCKYVQEKRTKVTESEIDAEAVIFREARNLISADEMEQWLENKHLTVEEWQSYIERNVIVHKFREEFMEAHKKYSILKDEVDEVLFLEGVCSRAFTVFSYKLAARAALFVEKQGDSVPNLIADLNEPLRSRWEALKTKIQSESHLEHLLKLEIFYRKFWKTVVTEELLEEEIDSRAQELIKFQLVSLSFAEETAALEGALCIRQDGMSLEQVAEEADAGFQEETIYLLEIDSAIRDILMGAKRGDLVGPLQDSKGEFQLIRIIDKQKATTQDQEARKQAARQYRRRIVHQTINAHVKWQDIV